MTSGLGLKECQYSRSTMVRTYSTALCACFLVSCRGTLAVYGRLVLLCGAVCGLMDVRFSTQVCVCVASQVWCRITDDFWCSNI